MKTYKRVLTIAGSDSGGGAGIQADLKTFAALGCYGMSVITALTAQNTQTVSAIHPVPAAFVIAQLEAVLTDIGVDAVKIGMLHSAEIIRAVADTLRRFQVPNIVLDPVMIAKSGDALLRVEAVESLKENLLPLASLITPNLPEAEVLLDEPIRSLTDMQVAARKLAQLTQHDVLIKGGHLPGPESTDCLYIRITDTEVLLKESRIATPNSHGTGCTLSSAITAGLASGSAMREAVINAKQYLTNALQSGALYTLGHGHGPVHHFAGIWN